jgi:hypothetical protein
MLICPGERALGNLFDGLTVRPRGGPSGLGLLRARVRGDNLIAIFGRRGGKSRPEAFRERREDGERVIGEWEMREFAVLLVNSPQTRSTGRQKRGDRSERCLKP